MAGNPIWDDPLIIAKQGRLATLRRLYHHVGVGGLTTDHDETVLGMPVTQENLSLTITALEHEIRDAVADLDGGTA